MNIIYSNSPIILHISNNAVQLLVVLQWNRQNIHTTIHLLLQNISTVNEIELD